MDTGSIYLELKKINRSSEKDFFSKKLKEFLVAIFSEKNISLSSLKQIKDLNLGTELEEFIANKFVSLYEEEKISFSSSLVSQYFLDNFSLAANQKTKFFKLNFSLILTDEMLLKNFNREMKASESIAASTFLSYLSAQKQNQRQKINLVQSSFFTTPSFISFLLLSFVEKNPIIIDKTEKDILKILLKNLVFRKILINRLPILSISYTEEIIKFLEEEIRAEELDEVIRAIDFKEKSWDSKEELSLLRLLSSLKSVSSEGSAYFKAFGVHLARLTGKKIKNDDPRKLIKFYLDFKDNNIIEKSLEETGGDDKDLRIKIISLIEDKSFNDTEALRQVLSGFFSENLIFSNTEEFQHYAKYILKEEMLPALLNESIKSFIQNQFHLIKDEQIWKRFSFAQKSFLLEIVKD